MNEEMRAASFMLAKVTYTGREVTVPAALSQEGRSRRLQVLRSWRCTAAAARRGGPSHRSAAKTLARSPVRPSLTVCKAPADTLRVTLSTQIAEHSRLSYSAGRRLAAGASAQRSPKLCGPAALSATHAARTGA